MAKILNFWGKLDYWGNFKVWENFRSFLRNLRPLIFIGGYTCTTIYVSKLQKSRDTISNVFPQEVSRNKVRFFVLSKLYFLLLFGLGWKSWKWFFKKNKHRHHQAHLLTLNNRKKSPTFFYLYLTFLIKENFKFLQKKNIFFRSSWDNKENNYWKSFFQLFIFISIFNPQSPIRTEKKNKKWDFLRKLLYKFCA